MVRPEVTRASHINPPSYDTSGRGFREFPCPVDPISGILRCAMRLHSAVMSGIFAGNSRLMVIKKLLVEFIEK